MIYILGTFAYYLNILPFPECDDMSGDSDSGNDWEESSEVHENIPCLFCTEITSGFPTALQHVETSHKLNFCDFIKKHIHDTYSYIKLINFIRCKEITSKQLSTLTIETWDKDEYLRPVIEDDPWLMYGEYKEFILKSVIFLFVILHKLY